MFYQFPSAPGGQLSAPPLVTVLQYSEKNLLEVNSLFQKVRDQLCEKGQGCFLLPRQTEFFEAALKGQDGFLIGAHSSDANALVGFCIVKPHQSLSAAYEARSLTLPICTGAAHPLTEGHNIAVVQSLCVDAQSAGKAGVGQKLLQHARQETGDARFLAQTGLANLCGVKSFSAAGYIVVGAATEVSNQWPTPKLLMLRLSKQEAAAMKDDVRIILAPQERKNIYGVQAALYRHVAIGGGFAKVQFMPGTGAFSAGLLPLSKTPSFGCSNG